MILKSPVPLRCVKCKGMKYIGEPYHAFSKWFVDVTCLVCSHSRDIEVNRLENILKKIHKAYRIKKATVKHDN
jgi:hypothetical protein